MTPDPSLPNAPQPGAPQDIPTVKLEDTLVTVFCEQLTFHQRERDVLERLGAALEEVWKLERERTDAFLSLSDARKALDTARAELNALWVEHRDAFLDDRPAILGKICTVLNRTDAIWVRIRELGG